MIDADRIDLVFRSRGRRAENARRNFLGFVERMLLRDRFRNVDRQELRFAPARGRRRDRVPGDFAVERANGHVGIERGVASHLGNLVGCELRHGNLVGADTRFREDDLQQCDIGLRPADHPDATAGEFVDRLDLGSRLPLRALCRQPGRRPQDDDILAQDDDGLGVGR